MTPQRTSIAEWAFGPGPPGRFWPRWLWLRTLGLIFFSAFYSYAFQVRGLIGPDGILPVAGYLEEVRRALGSQRFWYTPSLLWINSGSHALEALWIAGLIASVALVLNLWPRASIAVCLIAYLSIVTVGQDFSEYQSDGMLLAAGFLSFFTAPPALQPGLGRRDPPSRASIFMLQWLWLTIYFESGVVKLASHDPEWRHLTALDQYYQNGPLPNWMGWYAQQLPHGILAALCLGTLTIELGLIWLMFFPRPFRLVLFFVVTFFQLGIILTANLAFLNHLVLALGIFLLDDRFILALFRRLRARFGVESRVESGGSPTPPAAPADKAPQPGSPQLPPAFPPRSWTALRHRAAIVFSAVILIWIFYATFVQLLMLWVSQPPLPIDPVAALEPFRIANRYGLFATMTAARYEIEFQGSNDGQNWVAYPFRYKPQRLDERPRIYAPYQPRFDWNLWFASLGTWREYPWVVRTEMLLLQNDPAVITLFGGNPFAKAAPRQVRAVEWQYRFTDLKTKRATGEWWRREFRGLYAPVLELGPNGKVIATQMPAQQAQQ
ncbi:MAG TPA: lipase maturation factor family protein [Terriglobia bacterium]|nr:lipase maturation factor family protein [Terriglobia bacterium]